MRLRIGYRSFVDGKNRSHFLLAGAQVVAKGSLANGSVVDLAVRRVTGKDPGFELDIEPATLPARLTRLELAFTVDMTADGRQFRVLDIRQVFAPAAAGGGPTGITLRPGSWKDSLGRERVSNMSTHPLLDASRLAANRIELNALMLDLTEPWLHLHASNRLYQRYKLLTPAQQLTFKVFAHLAGPPLIWYAVVPAQLHGVDRISPHVFLSPADHAEAQAEYDDRKYLANTGHFATDGHVLFNYLLAPVADVQVNDQHLAGFGVEKMRNVVGFTFVRDQRGNRTGKVTTLQWNIGAGLQNALLTTGGGRPAQLLLLPQRLALATQGQAVTTHLKPATDTILRLLQTNTTLLTGGGDVLAQPDKMIISGYSESGYDLWPASLANQDNLKAIIAIEPQNLNTIQNDYRRGDPATAGPAPKVGKDVIPVLLRKNVKVFIIGRHHAHYRPQVPDLTKLRLLPANPGAIFAYPPNPSASPFIKYRVWRIVDPSTDPLMAQQEKDVLDELARHGVTGNAALARIFLPEGNIDKPSTDMMSHWYSHNFALTGGDDMTLDPSGLYGKPIRYRTFFTVAVQEIG